MRPRSLRNPSAERAMNDDAFGAAYGFDGANEYGGAGQGSDGSVGSAIQSAASAKIKEGAVQAAEADVVERRSVELSSRKGRG